MSVTRRRSPSIWSAGYLLTAWLTRVVFALSFVLGTASTAGATWSESDPIEEREGEGEGEDGKLAEALAIEAAAARRAGPGPKAWRDELHVPPILAPRRAAPSPPTWQRPRRTIPPDDDDALAGQPR